MDWVATGTMLSGVGTMIVAGAIIHATRTGSGLFAQWQWHREQDRGIALAERTLTTAYALRRAIEATRSPVLSGAERGDIHRQLRDGGTIDDRTPDYARAYLACAQAARARIGAHQPLWDDLLGALPALKALFGDNAETALDAFWTQRDRILAEAERYAGLARHGNIRDVRGYEQEHLFETQAEIETVLWRNEDRRKADSVADAIDAAVASLEQRLLPVIRSGPPLAV